MKLFFCYNHFMNSPSYFEIQADDVQRALEFYKEIFGWKFTKTEGTPIEYWRIETDGLQGGLMKRPAAKPTEIAGTNAFTCSMEVVDLDKTVAYILANRGRIALEKFAIPGVCWQGYCLDTEGNVFGLFQVDKEAK
jgi:uncharacterized protein